MPTLPPRDQRRPLDEPPATVVEFIDYDPAPGHVPYEVRINGVPVRVKDAEVITQYDAPTAVVLTVLPDVVEHRHADAASPPYEPDSAKVRRLEAALRAAHVDIRLADGRANRWEGYYHRTLEVLKEEREVISRARRALDGKE